MATQINKEQILAEDLETGFGVSAQTRGGKKVNADSLPYSTAQSIKDALDVRLPTADGDLKYAMKNGDRTKEFLVSQSTDPSSAVQKTELENAPFAKIGGDTLQPFLVADATLGTEATNRDTAQVMINSSLVPFALIQNILEKTNTTPYVPTQSYHPATKVYVDEKVLGVFTFQGEDTLDNILLAPPTPGHMWQTTTAGQMPDTSPVAIDDMIVANEASVWTNMGPIKGPIGDTGPQGTAATLNVGTTTTGAEGTDADVTNSGTVNDAIFDFIIPKGDTGAIGSQGPQGITGADSTVPGPIGPIGLDGPIGPEGPDGPIGPIGVAATATVGSTITGTPGSAANVANSGTTSAAIFDFTIPRGDVGAQGIQGPIGPDGADSTVPGPQGEIGPDGPTGPDGADSTVPGPQGEIGLDGPTGATGADSTVPGPEGPDGPQGAKGDAGTGLIFHGYEDPAVIVTLTATSLGDAYTASVAGVDSDGLAVAVDDVLIADNLLTPSHWVSIGAIKGPAGTDGTDGADSTVPGPTGPDGADSTVPGPIGPIGPDGADSVVPGPQGDPGADGADSIVPGPDGPTGSTGSAATIAVGVVTKVAAGGTPTVNNSGTTAVAVFDFGIVTGDIGATGADSVVPGPQGDPGTDGTDGTNGAPGIAGTDGLGWIKNPNGEYDALTGIVTFQSNDGLGFSSTDLRGTNGTDGTDGAQGIPGPDGTDGTDGGVGPQGIDGPQGPIGPDGADSVVPGPQGDPGADGADSIVPGPDGPIGPEGPTAVSADAGNTAVLGNDSLIFVPASPLKNDIFYENGQNVTADYTLTAGKNAMSSGPITVDDGITVTVPDGANWSVV